MELLIVLGIAGLLWGMGWSVGHDSGRAAGKAVGEVSGFRDGVREYMRKQLIESNTIQGTYNNTRLTALLLQNIRDELTGKINRN